MNEDILMQYILLTSQIQDNIANLERKLKDIETRVSNLESNNSKEKIS